MSKAWVVASVVAVAIALAWIPRNLDGVRRPFGPAGRPELERAAWFSMDPDGLYHARRVERAVREGLPIAGEDPYLNYPEGAAIPWPPYYDLGLWALLSPLAPEDEAERRVFIEHAVASVPMLFGLASAALAALVVLGLARGCPNPVAGGLVAAGTTALCRSSIQYSLVGIGDHHAALSFLDALLLALLGAGFAAGGLRQPRRGLVLGAGCGAIAGWMVGSWVASVLYVLNVQLLLAWLVIRRGREPLPGVAPFGLAFHLVAALVLSPAVLSSPWRRELPWMVINLSWFHLAHLLVGALVFAPLVSHRSALAAGSTWARRYPWLVGAGLALVAAALWLADAGPAHGVAEGLAWVSRADDFMGAVLESSPLIGPRSGGAHQLYLALGYGVLVLPMAWFFLARSAFRDREEALLPWAFALPSLLVLALVQRRFADALAVPMAVTLGWAVARFARGPRALLAPAGLAVALLAQLPSLRMTLRQGAGLLEAGARTDVLLGERMIYEWIRANTPLPPDYSVLASWDRGHMIEWAADRPSVATNFGSYIGVESYRDPPRFFLAEDDELARAILERHRTRYVLVPGWLQGTLDSMVRAVDPQGRMPPVRWPATMGARLLSGAPLGFLRLVHVSPYVQPFFPDPETGAPAPVGYVWEHVPGAAITARGVPGEEATVELRIHYPEVDHSIVWREVRRCDGDGLARFLVPYATDAPNGDGLVVRAEWSIGELRGKLVIPEVGLQSGRGPDLP